MSNEKQLKQMNLEDLLNFLEDGDLITLTGEDEKFIFNKSEMILEKFRGTPWPIELAKFNPDFIVNIERLQSIYKK